MFDHYFKWIAQYHKFVAIITVIICTALSICMYDASLSASFRHFFNPNNSHLIAYDQMEAEFNKQDTVVIIVQSKSGTIYNKRTLTLIYELTEAAWQIPNASRVNSLTNFQRTTATDDELSTHALIADPQALSPQVIATLPQIVASEPKLAHLLVGKASKNALISVQIQLPKTKAPSIDITNATRKIMADFAKAYPDHTLSLNGTVPFNANLTEVFADDLYGLGLASAIAICAIFLMVSRNLSGLLLTIVVLLFSICASFGIFTRLGYVFTPTHTMVPTALATICIANVIHIINSYYVACDRYEYPLHALRESMRLNLKPLLITNATTVIGVLTLNWCDAPPYKLLGNLIATGVIVTWMLSMTLVPAILAWLPKPSVHTQRTNVLLQLTVNRCGRLVVKHYGKIIVIFAITAVLACIHLPKLQMNEDGGKYFDKTYPIRQSTDLLNSDFAGPGSLHFLLRSKQGAGGVFDPQFLTEVDQFSAWLKQQKTVGYVDSFSDEIKRLNQVMNGDKTEFHQIPSSRVQAAQYTLLYELSLPAGYGIDNIVNNDRSAIKITASTHAPTSNSVVELDQAAQQWIKTHTTTIEPISATGLDAVFSYTIKRDVWNIISSSIAGLFLISVVLMFTFRSFFLGLLSLLPNVFPIILAYSVWSYVNGEITLAIAVVVCVSMGIVVDDTIHFMTKYQYARSTFNLDAKAAVRYAFQSVGAAMVITSVMLMTGFMILTLAHFTPTAYFGILMVMTVFFAIVADLMFTPALLIVFDKKVYANKERRIMRDRRIYDKPMPVGMANRRGGGDRRQLAGQPPSGTAPHPVLHETTHELIDKPISEADSIKTEVDDVKTGEYNLHSDEVQ